MRRLLPSSLIGQLALVMALALLVAQSINFGIVFSERTRAVRTQVEGPAIARFIAFAQRAAPVPSAQRPSLIEDRGRRRGRFSFDPDAIVPAPSSDERITARIREQANEVGLQIRDARAMLSDDPPPPPRLEPGEAPPRGRDRGPPGGRELTFQTLRLSVQFADGSWLNGRIVTPRPDPWIWLKLAASTLLIYLILLGAVVLIAIRLGRPLKELTAAAKSFEGRGEAPKVEERGPADVRRALVAFNAMSERVSAMLDEKDRMLGAIGHDMRTPLASLRIRIESMEPAAEREKVIETLEEMNAMLEETLALARAGRATENVRPLDLNALADAVVEEFMALGQPVEMQAGERVVAEVQPNLLRRALRNLIENAVRHGGSASVSVRALGDKVALDVADNGPGIPEDQLARVMEPFVRLEASRNRETGGSGLGLTLARSAAQAHRGALVLENRPEGGLLARILVPARTA
ncbi:MAG TPA: ATP-binding protein [Allosphingosinicella sp.]|nr:ATP-binding protein [Allosphingosinicella sp.]